MAYSDQRGLTRFNAVSFGGAFLINGVMLAGFVLLRPDVLPGLNYTPIELIPVRADDPIKPEPRPIETPPPPIGKITAPVTPLTPIPPREDFVVTDTGPITGGTGIAILPPVEPLPPIVPVYKGPRLDPRHANALQPAYPPGAIRNGLQGSVTVRVLIGADGRVKQVEPVSSAGDDFLAATRKQALAKWRFLPATRDGVPVEGWREMTVKFVIPKAG